MEAPSLHEAKGFYCEKRNEEVNGIDVSEKRCE
jgi:hypothetical protein